MEEIIEQYESLLNEKAALEKECMYLYSDYIREFGDQINFFFGLKLEAATLKKKIAFCVKKEYANETIYSAELDNYIDAEIADYRSRLASMIEEKKAIDSNESTRISFDESNKIRKLYYKIVHLIHPDLHPDYSGNEAIALIWQKSVDSYKRNDFDALLEAYDSLMIEIHGGEPNFQVDDVLKKIKALSKRIKEIREDEPYTYKFILDDPKEISALHDKIKDESVDYETYITSLKEELHRFKIVKGREA